MGVDDRTVAERLHGAVPQAIAQQPPTLREPEPSSVPRDNWPEPPTHEAFIGLAGEAVELFDPVTEADRSAVLVQLLVAVGNMIGRGPHFQVESDAHHLNTNAVLVGRTAKGRKGTSLGHVRRMLTAVDPYWAKLCLGSGLSSGEGLIWAVRDPIEQQQAVREKGRVVRYESVQVDAGVSDKRLLVIESEFSAPLRVMNREGNTLSAVIRQAWDGSNLRSLTKNSPAVATGPHISIIGHVTEEELRRHLTETDVANGFANRILWVSTRRSKVLPEGGAINERALSDLGMRLASAVTAARRIGRMMRDKQANELWRAVYPMLSEGGTGLLGAVTSRAEAHVMRLACIYGVLDGADTIRVAHLQGGLAMWQYCARSCEQVFGKSLGSTPIDRLLEALRLRPKGMNRTEIRDLFQRHKRAEEISAALVELETRALAFRRKVETGGRPEERWFLAAGATEANGAMVASVATPDRSAEDRDGLRTDCDEGDESVESSLNLRHQKRGEVRP